MSTAAVTETVGGHQLKFTNLDKVLYPEAGFTKGNVVEYYRAVAPVLLPHLRGRPLTMKRYPNGVDAQFFYQKEAPKHRPDWVRTCPVSLRSEDRDVNFLVIGSLPALLWIANLADIELHVALSRERSLQRPTALVFDLDPGPPASVIECCLVAQQVRKLGKRIGLEFFPKTSGSKGLQLYAPLRGASFADTKPFARSVAQLLENEHPQLVVSNMRKELREGKVLVDWSQNDDMKTTVCVYSLRARPQPTVSTPLTWPEVDDAARRDDPSLLVFDAGQVRERIERHGDLFEPVLKQPQRLPRL